MFLLPTRPRDSTQMRFHSTRTLDPTLRIAPLCRCVGPALSNLVSHSRSWIHCGVASADSETNTNLRDGRAGAAVMVTTNGASSSEESTRVKSWWVEGPGLNPRCGLSSAFDDGAPQSWLVHSQRLLQRRVLVAELERCRHLTTGESVAMHKGHCTGTLNTLTWAVRAGLGPMRMGTSFGLRQRECLSTRIWQLLLHCTR